MLDGKLSESTTIQERKKYFIKIFTDFKNRKSDIPEQLIHSFSPDSDYKVRKWRFTGIVHWTENICHQILIDEKYTPVKKELMDILRNDFCNDDFRKRDSTQEDIVKWDELITKILKILDNIQ